MAFSSNDRMSLLGLFPEPEAATFDSFDTQHFILYRAPAIYVIDSYGNFKICAITSIQQLDKFTSVAVLDKYASQQLIEIYTSVQSADMYDSNNLC